MIAVLAILHARPEHAAETEERLRGLASLTRQEPGAVEYWVHRQGQHDFAVYEKYVDQEACDAHFATRYVTDFLTRADTLLAEPPTVQFCAEVTGFQRYPTPARPA